MNLSAGTTAVDLRFIVCSLYLPAIHSISPGNDVQCWVRSVTIWSVPLKDWGVTVWSVDGGGGWPRRGADH